MAVSFDLFGTLVTVDRPIDPADALGCDVTGLVHVGDDPQTDGRVVDCSGTALLPNDVPLAALPARLAEGVP
ncbi:hypothetical protein [Halovivax sp.]|uniref:hypothetical protein n=1 Tax=Halovivax sp. TaxID=1935978 RepID=UPI0031B8AB2C